MKNLKHLRIKSIEENSIIKQYVSNFNLLNTNRMVVFSENLLIAAI